MRKIFFCRKCGYTGSADEYSTQQCPKCGTALTLTKFTVDEWHAMTPEQKKEAKAILSEQAAARTERPADAGNMIEEVSDWKRDLHKLADEDCSWQQDLHDIAKDVHFIKTVVFAYVVLVIAGLVIALLASVL